MWGCLTYLLQNHIPYAYAIHHNDLGEITLYRLKIYHKKYMETLTIDHYLKEIHMNGLPYYSFLVFNHIRNTFNTYDEKNVDIKELFEKIQSFRDL